MEDEKYELIDIAVIKRERRNKILITMAIIIVVIIIFVICGIVISKEIKKEPKQEETIPEEPQVIEEQKRYPVFSEEAKIRMQNIYEPVEGEEKVAYLTFDDGPSQNITPQILDILKNEDVKATFFVLGSRVELYPEILKREYEEGHYIANHGYSHIYTNVYASPQSVFDEYNGCEERIKAVLGAEYSSHLFRFPGGSEGGKYAKVKNKAKALLEENGVCHINWNCLTNDAVGKPTKESLVTDLKLTSNRKTKNCCFDARYRNETTYS